jgi:hypothetical protein
MGDHDSYSDSPFPTLVGVEIPLRLRPWKEAKHAHSLANTVIAANLSLVIHHTSSLAKNVSPLLRIGPLFLLCPVRLELVDSLPHLQLQNLCATI